MEKMLVLKMRKDNAKRAAPIGAALVVALRHCEARSSPGHHLNYVLGVFASSYLFTMTRYVSLKFRSSSHQSLASFVRRELLEVLDEA